MAKRKFFEDWKVTQVYLAQEGVCARCGAPLEHGFHRHHKDGNPANNSIENLELLCPRCHYATFGAEGEKNPWEEHKKLEEKMLQRVDEIIGKAVEGKMSGAVVDKILEAIKLELSLSRSINRINEELEKVPPSIAIMKKLYETRILQETYLEGFRDGVEAVKDLLCPKKIKEREA